MNNDFDTCICTASTARYFFNREYVNTTYKLLYLFLNNFELREREREKKSASMLFLGKQKKKTVHDELRQWQENQKWMQNWNKIRASHTINVWIECQ